MDWQTAFQFIGGLGFFLFSLKYMGHGLQNWAGEQLRLLLHRYTANPMMGVLIGIGLAIILQSSTAAIIITIGLVSAGFMTLRQSIGIILGANIGTTLTAFLLGFNIGYFAFPILALGAFSVYFSKRHTFQNMGQFLFGFGGMFIGLAWMNSAIKPVIQSTRFLEWSGQLSEMPVTGMLLGIITTAIVQSSSATVGILQSLYAQGGVSLEAAMPILYGENIGTTLTVCVASIGMATSAKRAALSHVVINIFGTILFFIVMTPFISYITWLQHTTDLSLRMSIAFAHGTFNSVTTIVLLPFIGAIMWIIKKCIKGNISDTDYVPTHLERNLVEISPVLAVGQAKEETIHMATICQQGYQAMREYVNTGDSSLRTKSLKLEGFLNSSEQTITNYLVKISAHQLSKVESERHHTLLETIRDLERIGDHVENIVELYDDLMHQRSSFSDVAMTELNRMFEVTEQMIAKAILLFDTADRSLRAEIMLLEEQVDEMERASRKKHIHRLNHGECSAHAGIIFSEMMSNLERIGDHCVNIAEASIRK